MLYETNRHHILDLQAKSAPWPINLWHPPFLAASVMPYGEL
jgi:hypothetical protein